MRSLVCRSLVFLSIAHAGAAQAPAGYYASVDTSNTATLRTTLHAVIDDHVRFPYTSSATDTWDILELADEDPFNSGNILDVYKNQSIPKQGSGNAFYDREHVWPNSYGFPDDGATNYPYTDCHGLFLCDGSYNTSRGNNPYRTCTSGCTERTTVLTNGQGGGSGIHPGNSNWRSGSGPSGSWETWSARRGDAARAILYYDVRYEGGTHGTTGVAEPDLIVTDNQALIATSGGNASVAYMGMLSELLAWNRQDPPDARERDRNDVVFAFQANRNPFIDHPEWVECVFAGTCSVGAAFCSGDGSATACPCGNSGAIGAGCASSLGFGGKLRAMGHASISGDTVVLAGSQMTNSFALYFQGTAQQNGGLGTVFGDGLRCAAGAVVRLATKGNVSGASQYPGPSDPPIRVRGQVLAPSVRYYQVWYRSAAPFCTGDTFNLTNGWQIHWQP